MSYLATDAFSASHFRIGAIALLSALLVWIASYDQDYLLSAGRLQQLMGWVGSRSYGIYLIHIPVYFLVREVIFAYRKRACRVRQVIQWSPCCGRSV